MKLFVGLDVSSFDIKVCFLNGEGDKLNAFTVSNDLPGAKQLRDEILNSTQNQSVSELRIGLESTSVYSFHQSMFLHNDESIRALDGQVLVMNPKQIANFKKSYSDMDKTDEIDAFVIADYLRFGCLPMSVVKEEQYVALQQLTRARYSIVRQITQEKQRFLQYLSYKCNTFTEEVESSVFGKAMMDLFLENYSLEELSRMPLEDLVDYLRLKGKNRFPDPKHVAKSIQKAVRSSYRLDKVVEDSIDTILGTSITLIRTFEKQKQEIDKSIKRIMKGIPQTLQTVPGIGPVFTPGIIAEIGQIEQFDDETKIAKYAGLYWRKHQSGRFTADETSLTRNGNQYLRYYLVEAANSVKKEIPEYGEYYAKKFKEVLKHQHKRALVLTARKFVRLVDALLRKNQIYTPKRSVNI
ncbi:IS110 family transposase [Virgibacillus pantothenticus]|uniref:IS110 family transposase n=1 Tax=Virgibacillus TaxID=84406 RepID=UPI0009098E4F|nr:MULTISPECIES: IS110 family transposase [Virgibacillus]API90737.1 IS110 family transposase [Virgibacillus sp. 6R]MBS7427662.1 IS110 family transposase [Virgibacillus sp. 19R1-5]MBU8566148.1 IS110 family transposase [Virgibacillus pantothenticus]MBU8600556.1 IS110 family transposase [Virgibacillus pantothenticus]MBU8634468.1 IS110 family transposase [Virgibacillus pantothenticus]